MKNIIKLNIAAGLSDSRFLILSAIILLAFISNAIIYSNTYHNRLSDWNKSVSFSQNELRNQAGNLQNVSAQFTWMIQPPSMLTFVSDSGSEKMPNMVAVNAFNVWNLDRRLRENETMPTMPALDWSFIVGTLFSLLAITLSYSSICGEKRDGTLRLLLSYPVSRLQLFIGKFVALFSTLVMVFILGVLVNLSLLIFNHALVISPRIVESLGWTIILSLLFIAAFVFAGMTVSSLVSSPAISLVILLIVWMLSDSVIPGMSQYIAKENLRVTTPAERDREYTTTFREIWGNAPASATNWIGDPWAKNIPHRAETYNKSNAALQQIFNRVVNEKTQQVKMALLFSMLSPHGLLASGFQQLSDTGVFGFESLIKKARQYRKQMMDFTIATDADDNDSPHLIYHTSSGRTDKGTYSTKSVNFDQIPKWYEMWESHDLRNPVVMPVNSLLILLLVNAMLSVVAFIALSRFDPR